MNAERVPVLMYHRVDHPRDSAERAYCIEPKRFAAHLDALAGAGWRAVSADDFVAWLQGDRTLPEQSFVLTFDDGFASVFEHAHPALKAMHWPTTMFLVSGLVGRTDDWPKTGTPAARSYPLLDRAQIASMQGEGWSFHAHSRRHRDLTTLTDAELDDEIAGCRDDLAALGLAPRYFAYPYGRFGEREAAAVRAAGYAAAFSVASGFNRRDIDRMRIRRLDVFGTDTPAMLLRKIKYGTNDGRLSTYARTLVRRVRARLF